jgi:hypothetical protein
MTKLQQIIGHTYLEEDKKLIEEINEKSIREVSTLIEFDQ